MMNGRNELALTPEKFEVRTVAPVISLRSRFENTLALHRCVTITITVCVRTTDWCLLAGTS